MSKQEDIAGGFFDASSDEEEEKKEMPTIDAKKEVNYCNLNFKELCEVNAQGGNPRLYELLYNIFKNPNDEDEQLTKMFGRPFLDHLTSRAGNTTMPSICEVDKGEYVFKGFPNSDYIR